MKVLLIALESIDNIGEELLRASTEFLVKASCEDVEITVAQLKPNSTLIPSRYKYDFLIGAVAWKCLSWLKGNQSYRIKDLCYQVRYTRYFSSVIRQCDKVILPVGMIKYGTQDFSYVFYLINKLATKYQKSVLMSAMSPQVGKNSDWRYHQLVEAVNMPAVKMLTTRDGETGVRILKSDYIRRTLSCDYVGDPALWIPDVYGLTKRKKTHGDVPYVGINIIRKGIFNDYNKSLTDDAMFNIYAQLIKQIEKRGWRWSVFTNGMKKDIAVLRELQAYLGFSESHVMPTCEDGKAFAGMISNFEVVFGARLHACITSVAVGTPVVGFVWDNKLKYFSETMKISQFFFQPSEMKAEKIVAKMEEAVCYTFDFENRDKYKQKTKESIRHFLMMN